MSITPVGDLDALRRQIAATHTRFAALGARLAQAAEAVTTAGALPPAALLREIHDAAQEFHAVRAAVLDVAASLEIVPSTPIRPVTSLHALAPLMDIVVSAAELAARRRRLDVARAAAFAILNRVSALTHRDDVAFRPLAACHHEASVLRATIVAADAGDVDAELRTWARATAPFAALLDLVDGPESADGPPGSDLEVAVAGAFGRALAAAAARGALVLGLTA